MVVPAPSVRLGSVKLTTLLLVQVTPLVAVALLTLDSINPALGAKAVTFAANSEVAPKLAPITTVAVADIWSPARGGLGSKALLNEISAKPAALVVTFKKAK